VIPDIWAPRSVFFSVLHTWISGSNIIPMSIVVSQPAGGLVARPYSLDSDPGTRLLSSHQSAEPGFRVVWKLKRPP